MTKTIEEMDLELATRFVIENPRAKEFIWWVLGLCNIYGAPHTVNGETGIHIGRRIIGVSIIDQISSIDPTAYARMMIEAHNRAETRKGNENAESTEE